jgi:hypothetical protein
MGTVSLYIILISEYATIKKKEKLLWKRLSSSEPLFFLKRGVIL